VGTKEKVKDIMLRAVQELAELEVSNFFFVCNYDDRIQRISSITDLDELEGYLAWVLETKREKIKNPEAIDETEYIAIQRGKADEELN
jgi:hypothetical protein